MNEMGSSEGGEVGKKAYTSEESSQSISQQEEVQGELPSQLESESAQLGEPPIQSREVPISKQSEETVGQVTTPYASDQTGLGKPFGDSDIVLKIGVGLMIISLIAAAISIIF